MLTETLLLAIVGGAAGLLLAEWLTQFLSILIPSNIGEQLGMAAAGLDGRVLAFTLTVSVLAGIVAGIVPALASANAAQTLEGRRAIDRRGAARAIACSMRSSWRKPAWPSCCWSARA